MAVVGQAYTLNHHVFLPDILVRVAEHFRGKGPEALISDEWDEDRPDVDPRVDPSALVSNYLNDWWQYPGKFSNAAHPPYTIKPEPYLELHKAQVCFSDIIE